MPEDGANPGAGPQQEQEEPKKRPTVGASNPRDQIVEEGMWSSQGQPNPTQPQIRADSGGVLLDTWSRWVPLAPAGKACLAEELDEEEWGNFVTAVADETTGEEDKQELAVFEAAQELVVFEEAPEFAVFEAQELALEVPTVLDEEEEYGEFVVAPAEEFANFGAALAEEGSDKLSRSPTLPRQELGVFEAAQDLAVFEAAQELVRFKDSGSRKPLIIDPG